MSLDKITTPVAREGYPFIIIMLVVTAVIAAVLGLHAGTAVSAGLLIFTVCFFRNPARVIPENPLAVISPADGRVIGVDEIEESRFLNKRIIRVSVFMSVFNVHVNRIPCNGVIKGIFYNNGKFLSAFKEKASLDNEQNAILMETDSGKQILFIQIAGLIARRIVCYLKKEDKVRKGDRFGLIRFGSRVDIYLPADTKINVKPGQNVSAGSTVIGYLN